jgi:hypothetical protein
MTAQGPYAGVTIVSLGEAALDKQTRKARKVAVQESKDDAANKAANNNKNNNKNNKKPKKGKPPQHLCVLPSHWLKGFVRSSV